MIMYHFEFVKSFIKADLVIPFEAHVYRACAVLRQSFPHTVIESAIEEPRLIS
jgi:hypothetical protein